ncbi:MAG: DNRLRE domain-containing protein [Gaiellaceae bacterium]
MEKRVPLAALAALAFVLPAAPARAATTVKAAADSFVASDQPTKNFGTASRLNVKASPATNAYLRFSVPGSAATVKSATLQVYATHDSKLGVTAAPVADSSWGEKTITWQNAPAISAAPVTASGAFKSGKWVPMDVTPMVASGTVTLGLKSPSGGDSTNIASREDRSHAPQLVIEFTSGDPTIMAAGDIACSAQSHGASCQDKATSDLVLTGNPDAVLALGDNQYECGVLSDYQTYYDATWGRFKDKTRPVPGNHEYTSSLNSTNNCYGLPTGAPGYYTYFGAIASPLEPLCGVDCKGYYSYDLGSWHMIALNSNCTRVGNCGATDPQATWLAQDLQAHAGQCTLAYFHHPRWTSGQEGPTVLMGPIYQMLYDAGVDAILNGHDHDYERFAPLDPSGAVDPVNGIREIIAGTGGRNTTSFTGIAPGSEVRNSTAFGVLSMTLHSRGYDWRFVPTAGTFSDSGSQPCHIARGDDTTAPAAPGSVHAVAGDDGLVDLTWSAASDDVGVVAYRIYRNGTLLTTTGQATGYTDGTTTGGTGYTYSVRAVDASGNESNAGSSVGVTARAALPGLLFADGFETGTMGGWTGAVGIVPEQGSAASGAWRARAATAGGTAYAYWTLGAAQPELYYRLRFEVISSGSVTLLKLRNTAGQTVTEAALSSTGRLLFRNTLAGTTASSGVSPSTGRWHELEVHLATGASGLLEGWLDGTRVYTASESFGDFPLNRIQLGDNTSGTSYDLAFDDVDVGTQQLP